MVDKVAVSTVRLCTLFSDQEAARLYLEKRMWPSGVVCPTCKEAARITPRKGGYYRCNTCKLDFTVRTGTIFERSHVPLHKWLLSMYLLVTSHRGMGSMPLSREIGITQKSAWFVIQRLREACGNDLPLLRGVADVSCKDASSPAVRKSRIGRGMIGNRIMDKGMIA